VDLAAHQQAMLSPVVPTERRAAADAALVAARQARRRPGLPLAPGLPRPGVELALDTG
jgi:hypothetical protein